MNQFKSKGQTLLFLKKFEEDEKFIIPKLLIFNIKHLKYNKRYIFDLIKKSFPKKLIAIRSSSLSEDGKYKSNAGKYLSFLSVKSHDFVKINLCIRLIIESYKNDFYIEKNEIIFQEMVSDVSISGVCFTKELNSYAPYYVINYDDYYAYY